VRCLRRKEIVSAIIIKGVVFLALNKLFGFFGRVFFLLFCVSLDYWVLFSYFCLNPKPRLLWKKKKKKKTTKKKNEMTCNMHTQKEEEGDQSATSFRTRARGAQSVF